MTYGKNNEMSNQIGKSDSRTLIGGEIINLLKEPSRKWKIRNYECHQNVHIATPSGGLVFEYLEGLPKNWKDREFDTCDEAVEFVEQEIRNGKVPANSQTDK
jgi:hypothetical protein